MKTNKFIRISALLLITFMAWLPANTIKACISQDTAYISAISGLKLRLSPDLRSEVVTVMEYGEKVVVIEILDAEKFRPPRMGWTEGAWVLVDYYGMSGYTYNGFLTGLPIPDPRLSSSSFTLCGLLEEYTKQNFELMRVDTVRYHDRMDENFHVKYKYFFSHNVQLDYHLYWDNESVELKVKGIRIMDAYHLLQGLLTGYQNTGHMVKDLLFKSDTSGRIYEISNRYTQHIKIADRGDEVISIIVNDFMEGC